MYLSLFGVHGLQLKEGEWLCRKCGANVFATKSTCFKCHTPRSGAVVVGVPAAGSGPPGKKPRLG